MAETKMVQKQTWIKALRPIEISKDKVLIENQEALVDESVAVEFCDKKFQTCYPFSGERSDNEWKKEYIQRAVRIEKPTEVQK